MKAHVKKAFWCGYNKDKMSRRVKWHGQNVKYCSFFFVCLHFRCSNEHFLALIKQKSISNALCCLCLSLTSHRSVCSYRVIVSFCSSIQFTTKWHRTTHWLTVLQHPAASLFPLHNIVLLKNPLLASRCSFPQVFFHSTSWCRVTCLISRPVVSEQSAFQQRQTVPCLFFVPFC